MVARKVAHPSLEDRRSRGKAARTHAPLPSHTGWEPASDRPDPVALLQEQDADREQDLVPAFLQVKQATASVLEDHLPKSRFKNPGERVVQGQRLMQAASDIFLGWTKGVEEGRFFYWRQLRDMKASFEVEALRAEGLTVYGRLCAWTLARAHARSGDPVAIAAYLGSSDKFDRSITDFSERSADQNQRDFDAFVAAVGSGRLEAVEGL